MDSEYARQNLGRNLPWLDYFTAFHQYTCRDLGCASSRVNLGYRGHGRAWQVVARKLEVFPRLFGSDAYLLCFGSLRRDIMKGEEFPSYHDMAE
ncbi:hypothetical protein K469DRAFT_711661 [Zopfia rhizophila CBS 207.26]|uniref:Uncharacterized protein n=1 Tax=Zopfia rhizophila CBS 207.26 TaxID=1314779 RepID=A0A6A6DSD1_9PEZI|nr:hypothetical protein K469DRAFT_711661 [Zopfia rhizophila CBS 207.26]